MSGQQYFLGTDIGTSATKTVMVSLDGKIVATDTAAYEVITPRPMWAEQWPDVWFSAAVATIRNVMEKSRVPAAQVGGLTISGLYGGSGIPCDENMTPLHPCLIWMDRRATDEVEWVKKNIDEETLFDITANYVDSYYGYTKILWLKNNRPDVWKKTRQLVTPYAYCAYKLTGVVHMDHCSAGDIGGIYDAKRNDWSEDMLTLFGISRSFFPETLVDSASIIGKVHDEGAALTGLLSGTPVGAGGVDCVVATLSAGGIHAGEHVAMIGTSMAWGLVHSGQRSNKKLINMPYVVNATEQVYSFAGASTSGAIVKWFPEEFAQGEKVLSEQSGKGIYQLLDEKAAKLPPGSEGLVMLPYLMGERAPVWNANARGSLYGFTLYHTQAHVYRAILEAVAYSLRNGIENAKSMNIEIASDLILVGGVAKSSLWKQIFSDVTGCAIHCAAGGGEAAYGDAFLAALCTGAVDNVEEIKKWISFEEPVLPGKEGMETYDRYYRMFERYYDTLLPIMDDLAAL